MKPVRELYIVMWDMGHGNSYCQLRDAPVEKDYGPERIGSLGIAIKCIACVKVKIAEGDFYEAH